MKWDFYRKLAIPYNVLLLLWMMIAVFFFFVHEAAYKMDFDLFVKKLYEIDARAFFMLSGAAFFWWKVCHWNEVKARVWREGYEAEFEEPCGEDNEQS